MKGRLVVVSNRVGDPRQGSAGGLAVAVGEALSSSGGLWFGWSGKIIEGGAKSETKQHRQSAGNITLATIDLSRDDYDSYYLGFSNRVIWPVFHYRLDLADLDAGFFEGYQRVNRVFAHRLMAELRPDDVIWIHDYHLIPLAAELRALGCTHRIGFFLHIPLPPPLILAAIPGHEWLIRSLFAYDLVGLQSHADVAHFARYVTTEANAEVLPDDHYRAFGRIVRASAYPIGIDVEQFRRLGEAEDSQKMLRMMREQYAQRELLVGVDRLDYSKGLPQRFKAFRLLLARYPENRRRATLVEIAPPTREDVEAYADIRRELEGLAGSINGEFGELDWMPIRYIHRAIARKRLPGLYRAGRVALVTPLRDGMNLVAKEYLASQDPDNPGVLVLSRFAGAAEQLSEALLVNPYDTVATAETIERALRMPLEERRERHRELLRKIRTYDVHWWWKTFLQDLANARRENH
ncbi:MAG: alpha,alpha-trehalose-phosphate synthase (UDP-forming) [Betaproteobacteria bacterium]|nr:alpha,alpha-trehalose-phosphate synthase (UDP-forming) [Betaproteobacteria bacterium]